MHAIDIDTNSSPSCFSNNIQIPFFFLFFSTTPRLPHGYPTATIVGMQHRGRPGHAYIWFSGFPHTVPPSWLDVFPNSLNYNITFNVFHQSRSLVPLLYFFFFFSFLSDLSCTYSISKLSAGNIYNFYFYFFCR